MTELTFTLFDGFITAIETLFFWYLLRGRENAVSSFYRLLFYCLLTIMIIIATISGLNMPMKLVLQVVMLIFIGVKFYDFNKVTMLLYWGMFMIILLGCELLVIQFWDLLDKSPINVQIGRQQSFILEVIILAKAFNFSIIVIIEKIMNKKGNKLRLKDIYPYIVTNLSSICVLICIYLNLFNIEKEEYILGFLISSFLLLFSLFYNVIAINNYIDMKDKEQMEEYSNYELHMKCDYYKSKLRDEEKLKATYHDFKNHLLILENSAMDDDVIQRSIEELKYKIADYENYYDTGNEFLDIIMKEKMRVAKEEEIDMNLQINFEDGKFFSPIDISSIFGNLLDNAIEACKKVERTDRFISVKVSTQKNCLNIIVKNSVEGEVNVNHTSKEDKYMHGFGISNIKKVVEKFNGVTSIDCNSEVFVFSIVIPINER